MNDLIYRKIIDSGMRVTRRIRYSDFTDEQYSELHEYYWKKHYLNVAETAIFLRCSSQTVYRLIDEGLVKKVKSCIKKPFVIDIRESFILINMHENPDDIDEIELELRDELALQAEIKHSNDNKFAS